MLIGCAALMGAAGQAHALTYFNGPDGFGFANDPSDPLEESFVIASDDEFSGAGSRQLNDGSFALSFNSKQSVKKKAKAHFRIKVEWTIKNKTGETLDEALLLITALGQPSDFPDYNDAMIVIDEDSGKPNPFTVARFDRTSGDDMYFLGFVMSDMAPGKDGKVKVKFKYDVFREGGLVKVDGEKLPPAAGVAAVLDPTVVPEPSAIMLLGAGAVALTWWSRRRQT